MVRKLPLSNHLTSEDPSISGNGAQSNKDRQQSNEEESDESDHDDYGYYMPQVHTKQDSEIERQVIPQLDPNSEDTLTGGEEASSEEELVQEEVALEEREPDIQSPESEKQQCK